MTLKALRWGLPGIFVVGYLVCDRVIGPLDQSFLLLTILNIAVLVLLLSTVARIVAARFTVR